MTRGKTRAVAKKADKVSKNQTADNERHDAVGMENQNNNSAKVGLSTRSRKRSVDREPMEKELQKKQKRPVNNSGNNSQSGTRTQMARCSQETASVKLKNCLHQNSGFPRGWK